MINITWSPTLSMYEVQINFDFYREKDLFEKAVLCIKTLPVLGRDYRSVEKIWIVDEPYLKALKTVFDITKLQYTVVEKPKATTPFMQTGVPNETDRYILTFFKLLPYDVVSRAFKFGMAALHPDKAMNDKTIDPDEAAKLSEAWTFLEKTYFQK